MNNLKIVEYLNSLYLSDIEIYNNFLNQKFQRAKNF
jgi:hypothetical protein